ncbi:MAG: TetR/AcrR family transcriptional regulator [Alphaproteobacteria bacterium]|nr:TetR/AcrR family transcriptional regulator [Alphaproteobacteria bacterium]MBU0796166.1 TetR/AcrR family transcriptional regulator [Alphaproteobacteria bacterium]MBU0888041.1 TetR/AcrR family transcriptional regulator [Alphaproteobacteria bacterium]MBU1813000.1 TetR/AcrR family transcriptional regulator [Alphaproteobacteria bacterium]MBU2089371.1 TetR/AcrR family transcriptional regulator [Alphaproteobacteria bacterium]
MRRSNPDRTAATRAALLETAHRHFAARGYAETALEDLVQEAGVSRGALYHHFSDKQGLFAALVERLQGEVAARIDAAAGQAGDRAWDQVQAGCVAFLDAYLDPALCRILLVDAPSVLGWRGWREVDARHALRSLVEGVEAAVAQGDIVALPPRALAHALSGALDEAALMIAGADNPQEARREAGMVIARLLDGLRR